MSGAPDRGKVILGLECCTADLMEYHQDHFCDMCPYKCHDPEITFCCNKTDLMRDALSLLKAQEPRVMTLVEAMDAEVAWLERYADPKDGVEPIIQPIIVKCYKNGYWQCLVEQDESPDLTLFIEDFKTEFRFWTSRPTDEQREATQWAK